MADVPPRTPAVHAGRLNYTSVSALQKASTCLAQWHFRYVLRRPDKPPSKGQERGESGHKALERYLTKQITADELPPLERLGVERGFVPHPDTPGLKVEFALDGLAFADDVPLVGRVDLVQFDKDKTVITDWKFKKDIDKWGETGESLLNPAEIGGLQMVGYAAALGGAHTVVRHVSFQTHRRADVVEARSPAKPLAFFQQAWQDVTVPLVRRMREAAVKPYLTDADKNQNACHRFGGCPYRDECFSVGAKLFSLGGADKMGFFSNQPPAAPSEPPPAVTAPADPPSVEPSSGGLEARLCVQGKSYLVEGQPARFMTNANIMGRAFSVFAPLENPGSLPLKVPQTALVLPLEVDTVEAEPEVAEPAQEAKPPKVEAAPEPVAGSILPPGVKRGRGRPRKDGSPPVPKAGNTVLAVDTPITVERVATAPAPAPEPEPPSAPAPVAGIRLFFVGTPLGVVAKTLDAYVSSLDANIRQVFKSTACDLRCSTAQELDFGKWRGVLAHAVTVSPPPPGDYLVRGEDERIKVVAQALIPLAALVVML